MIRNTVTLVALSLLAVACLFAVACGGGATHAAGPSAAARLVLLDVVPDGASAIVSARPDVLWASPVTRRIVGSLVAAGSLDALATHTGVDARLVTEAVLAEYPGGFLLLVRGPFVASELVAESEVRMSVIESRSESPFVRRSGLFGTDRRELVALDRDVLLIGSDPEPLSTLLACLTAMRRNHEVAHECRPALPPGPLRTAHTVAPLVVFAPQHLDLPPGLGASLLLAEERELAVDVTPTTDAIALDLDLRGDLPPHADENFRALCESIARSDFGAVMGLDMALPGLRIQQGAAGVRITTQLASDEVVRGLGALFGGEIRAMLPETNH